MKKQQPQEIRQEETHETEEQLFHRVMDSHLRKFQERLRMMRRTSNAHRYSAHDADLIGFAVQGAVNKFLALLKSRTEEEEELKSIWQ